MHSERKGIRPVEEEMRPWWAVLLVSRKECAQMRSFAKKICEDFWFRMTHAKKVAL